MSILKGSVTKILNDIMYFYAKKTGTTKTELSLKF